MQLLRDWNANLFGLALLGLAAPLLPTLDSAAIAAEEPSSQAQVILPQAGGLGDGLISYGRTRAKDEAEYGKGQILLRQGNFRKAREALQLELARAASAQDRSRLQSILLDLALTNVYLGQLPAAQGLLQQLDAQGPLAPELLAHRALTQAQIFIDNGKFPETEVQLGEAEAHLSKTRPHERRRYQLTLGRLHRSLGRYADSLAVAKTAVKLPGDAIDQAQALQLLGDVNWDLSQMRIAETSYRDAVAAYGEINDSLGQSRVLQRLGWIYQEMERWEDSEQAYTDALEQSLALEDVKGQMSARLQLGQVALKQGQLDKAELILTDAISKGQPSPVLARLHLMLGQTYVQAGAFDQALAQYDIVANPARQMGNAMTGIMLLRQQGEVYLLQGKLRPAEQKFKGAIAAFENLRHGLWDQQKVTLFDAHVTLYDRLQETLIAQERFEEALVVSEQSRARAFNELLAQRLVANHGHHEVVKGHADHKEISAPPDLNKIRKIARHEAATIVQYAVIHPLTQTYVETSNAPDSNAPERLLTWVIPPSGTVTFHQQDLDELEQPLAQWVAQQRGQISSRGNTRGGFAFNTAQAELIASRLPEPEALARQNYEPLQEFHRLLIEPIADALPKEAEETVVLVPHKALLMVPFAALQDQQGEFLVERHTPRIITSIQALALTEKKKEVAQSTRLAAAEIAQALVVGNPVMPHLPAIPGQAPQQLSPLPGSEFEAQQISPLLKTQPLIGKRANEGKVSQEMLTSPILHFATHGLFDEQHGLNSSLALTAEGGDGFLTAEEIMDLRLRADLAVLSACDTARGAITGDGVVGLSRSFFAAGVPSVLSSLWPVADFSTAELMEQFYENLQTEPDKAQALRQAMLDTMEVYPDPADWGAFILMGQS